MRAPHLLYSAGLHLNLPDRGTGDGVALLVGVHVVENTGIGRGVGAWEGDQGIWLAGAATGDAQLTASDVELGDAGLTGFVQRDLLHANEILAAGPGTSEE